MAKWAQPTTQRQQVHLFSPTLDAMIPDDHPARLFDELLSMCDWSSWEKHYCLVHGQPPIHPRIIAGVILYGLSRGMRSSRTLEYMLGANIDCPRDFLQRQLAHVSPHNYHAGQDSDCPLFLSPIFARSRVG